MKYYILTYKWTGKFDGFICFWKPEGRGYTWRIEDAGLYNREEAIKFMKDGDVVAIPAKDIDKHKLNVVYDDHQHHILPNIGKVRKDLSLLQSRMMKRRSECPSSEFMFQAYTAFTKSGADNMDFSENDHTYTSFTILKIGIKWTTSATAE